MSQFDLGGLTDMLGGFQAKLDAVKQEAAALEATGEAGGGAVKVTANGSNMITELHIAEVAMDDKELLEDMVRAAANEALRKVQEASAAKLSSLASGLPIPEGML